MRDTLRLGGGAGFAGDRLDAPLDLADRGELDYLVLECLAERTIALAQLRRRRDPTAGYDARLAERIESLLPILARRRVRLLGNFGAANPLAAADAIVAIAKRLEQPVKVAAVTGDDVLDLLDVDAPTMESGVPLSHYAPLVSANVYLGAEAMLPALASGADIVVTGRVADPSLFVALLMHEYGWAADDFDRLARGTAVGHLLECAGQLCGGYFADPGRKDIFGMAHLGFPYADVAPDGDATLSKIPGTGGRITRATATEQLLYEVTDPHGYLTPDVTADFSGVTLTEAGPDRIVVRGARGRARPDKLKVSVGYLAGYVGEGEIGYAGTGALARARLAGEIVRERLAHRFPELRIDLIGSTSLHGRAFDSEEHPYEVRLRVAGRARSREEAALIGDEVEALYTNGPAGGGGARKYVTEQIGIVSTLIGRSLVASAVTIREWKGEHVKAL
ncbi:MAG TPA: acyclic terpene utilization AtuA family protein [Casimicrobiaceae bacterium]|nr:acyclic terpene utilization AtuA family protein [Casimicrobiaceae bacterium]